MVATIKMKDSSFIKNAYLDTFNNNDDDGFQEDIEEELDEEVEENILFCNQKSKPIIIKKFQNWENEYLD